MIRGLYFDYPQAAYLLLVIPLLVCLMIWLARERFRALQLYTSSKYWPSLVQPRSTALTWIKNIAWSLSWIFASLALMGPKGNLQYLSLPSSSSQEIPRPPSHDLFFLVDVSGSMGVPDANQGRTRLEEAKAIMDEAISELKGPNVALDAFSSELIPLVPPTLDYLFTRIVNKDLQINEGEIGGTHFKQVLESLRKKLFSTPINKLYTLIILSDGGDNEIEQLQGQAREQAIQAIVAELPSHQENYYQVITIGIGSEQGGDVPGVQVEGKFIHSKLEKDLLEALARQGEGIYLGAAQYTVWELAQKIVHQMDRYALISKLNLPNAARQAVMPAKEEEIYYDLYFQIPLGLAIVCLCLTFILPDTFQP